MSGRISKYLNFVVSQEQFGRKVCSFWERISVLEHPCKNSTGSNINSENSVAFEGGINLRTFG
jgi:hypothetical protein